MSTAPGSGGRHAVGHVLVVCTGNVCRSPYVERRLAQLLGDAGLVAGSAGTRALVGAPMEPGSVSALTDVGADPDGFAARQLTPALLIPADLVITATQRHRREVVALHPAALRRTFTLGELAHLLEGVDAADVLAVADDDAPWARAVGDLARSRRGLEQARPADETDIPDPYGRGPAAYQLMSRSIETHLLTVAPVLRPPAA